MATGTRLYHCEKCGQDNYLDPYCYKCGVATDGLHGTDGTVQPPASSTSNIHELFKDKGSRSVLDPKSKAAMLEMLERLAVEVAAEKITGLALMVIHADGKFSAGTFGRGSYTEFLGGVEDLKLEIAAEHRQQQARKPW